MANVELAPRLLDDIDRILAHLASHEVADGPARVQEIIDALAVLETNPLIGRPIRDDLRELVIGRRPKGYIALYRYVAVIDTAFVLAIRSQRESGFKIP